MSRVLYPGSFDPITKGHMNIIEQACALFDEVVVAVMNNSSKNDGLFSVAERVEMIRQLYAEYNNVKIVVEEGATVDVALLYKCGAIIRGLRNISDFTYEVEMQQINRELSDNKVNTICLFADRDYQLVSSSMVKEIANLGKDIDKYVSGLVKEKMLIKGRI